MKHQINPETLRGLPSMSHTWPSLGDTCATSSRAEPALLLLLQCANPGAGSLRISIAGADRIGIGRGRSLTAADGEEGRRLEVPDRWMSSNHAELRREVGGWALRDLGSRNGCLVNGRRIAHSLLRPGDLVELGHTFFLFGEDFSAPALRHGGTAEGLDTLITYHPGLAKSLADLQPLAPSKVPIMLWGETGTGKEVIARALHVSSGRTGPFVALNCGGLTQSLAEAELFGFRKGSFTGATDNRTGIIRSAHGGTLLLDEIAELGLAAQASLLRVLQESEVVPIGETRPVSVDVRIITATHQRLEERVARGSFRPDLLARLRGFEVALPPLRERRADLGVLCTTLLSRLPGSPRLAPPVVRAMYSYAWPHNIRELERALEAAVILAGDGDILLEHLPVHVREGTAAKDITTPRALSDQDLALRERLVGRLRDHDGNLAAVARAEGKAVIQIRRWLKRCGLDPNEFR